MEFSGSFKEYEPDTLNNIRYSVYDGVPGSAWLVASLFLYLFIFVAYYYLLSSYPAHFRRLLNRFAFS